MANVWQTIGDFGGDILGSVGTNLEANAQGNLADAERVNVNNTIALTKLQNETENKKRLMKLLETTAIGVIIILGLVVLTYSGIKIYKAIKT